MKMKAIITILILSAGVSPATGDVVWTEGHHEINAGDVYGEIRMYNDCTLDIFGGDIGSLDSYDMTMTNWYDGQIVYHRAHNSSIVNIYGGNLSILAALDNTVVNLHNGFLDRFASEQKGVLNLYAYDVVYHLTGGYWDGGWIEGKYLENDLHFRFDIPGYDTLSLISIVPEPTTIVLLGFGGILLRTIKNKTI